MVGVFGVQASEVQHGTLTLQVPIIEDTRAPTALKSRHREG